MFKLVSGLLLVALLVAPATRADANLTTTWRDPAVTKINFTKVVVAFISSDADLRRRVEGGLARRIPRSVAANTIVPDDQLKDREAVKAQLLANAVDAAIVVRLVDVKRETVVSQGESWYVGVPTFWDTWDTNWMTVNTASYAYENKVVTADIILYSVATAKPVWVGRLKATNPKFLKGLLDDLVKAGSKELRKQKLI
ncbi:MAG TPA: hypothetical protein VNS63_23700 [Blastocatellia bacterium]|nr:hypothetical protein [Blastocatellia bacterium]